MRLVNCNDGDCISSVLSGAVLPSEKGGFVLKCFLLSPVLIKKKKKKHKTVLKWFLTSTILPYYEL